MSDCWAFLKKIDCSPTKQFNAEELVHIIDLVSRLNPEDIIKIDNWRSCALFISRNNSKKTLQLHKTHATWKLQKNF